MIYQIKGCLFRRMKNNKILDFLLRSLEKLNEYFPIDNLKIKKYQIKIQNED